MINQNCETRGVYNLLVERSELVRTRWPKIHVVIEDVHEVIAQERRERAARAAGR